MTAKRDLKKRIRERSARTGESYTAARSHVLGDLAGTSASQPPVPAPQREISVIEFEDFTDKAARLGIRCRVLVAPELAIRIDHASLLTSFLHAVLVLDEPDETFRALVLRGECADLRPVHLGYRAIEGLRRFVARAQAGIGGLSPSGRALAFHMVGREGLETVLCTHLFSDFLRRKPGIILASPRTSEGPNSLLGFFL